MEVWILIFTLWATTETGDYKPEEYRAEFATSDACAKEGTTRLTAATGKGQPATFFCFKKGEKVG